MLAMLRHLSQWTVISYEHQALRSWYLNYSDERQEHNYVAHGEKQKKSNNVPPSLPPSSPLSRHRAVFCSSQNHGTQYNVNWRSIRSSWKRVLHGGQCSRRRLPAHISLVFSLCLTFNLSSSMSLFRSCLFNWVFFFPMETVCYLKHHGDNIHEGSLYILYVRQPDGEKMD